MLYILTQSAKKDVKGIWNYTAEKWGMEQADRYLRKLESSFDSIARGECVGKKPLSSFENVRSVRCEHHYIFYLYSKRPIILAVLHEKMDFVAKLRERLG